MPKLGPTGGSIKLSLDQVVETGNVRTEYQNIEELAASIKKDGLFQAIVVKALGYNEDGIATYELCCGHRRIRAFRLLCERGDDFAQIDAVVKTGNKRTIQLVENVQREDLSPIEKERAVSDLLAEGFSQTEIARELSKSISWVSDLVAAAAVREKLASAGVDAADITSRALSQLRSLPESELPKAAEKLVEQGGTVAAATGIMREHKIGTDRPPVSSPRKTIAYPLDTRVTAPTPGQERPFVSSETVLRYGDVVGVLEGFSRETRKNFETTRRAGDSEALAVSDELLRLSGALNAVAAIIEQVSKLQTTRMP